MALNRSGRVLALIVAWSSSLAPGGAVYAQAGAAEEARALGYDELVKRGVAEYQRGHWIEARAFFTEAHAVQPNARTLRGLGMTCYQLGRYVEAIDHFEHALSSPLRPLGEDLRSEVTRLLRDAERMVARLRIDVTPADARLRVDGLLVKRNAQGIVLLDAGPHELLVHAPGHESVMRTLDAQPGEELALSIQLRSFEVAQASAPQPAPVAVTKAEAGPSSSAAPWILVGASGVVLVTGAVLLGVALSDKAAVEDVQPGEKTWAEIEPTVERVPVLSGVGIGLLSAGAVGALAGLAWRFWPESEQRGAITLQLGPAGLRAAGSF